MSSLALSIGRPECAGRGLAYRGRPLLSAWLRQVGCHAHHYGKAAGQPVSSCHLAATISRRQRLQADWQLTQYVFPAQCLLLEQIHMMPE
jgi:hypothetical protein